MIGIGTDIVEIDRVEAVWRRHGERFEQRILTPDEVLICQAKAQPWRYLAKRFAAKEAVAKSIGTGIGVELSWQDIELRAHPSGAPVVHLSPRGSALAKKKGGSTVMLSLSDERAYAVAFALLLA
ncbi:holo-ACP synthase [Congregibacter variabilis]|uniref:Holo-[acyl-carrier-protein] synthase n=1 Tax=Congregibacter variabilis TaxID=3081200 RepID=A0ABZ0I352_9GAMM|nr:holo-ACP synthase [Congregibacter sp. IMCC43200]